MARIDEADILSERFWKGIDSIGVDVADDGIYANRVTFLLLFLHLLPPEHELQSMLLSHVGKSRLPDSYQFSWIYWFNRLPSEQVTALADVHAILSKAIGHPSEAQILDTVGDPRAISTLLSYVERFVEEERNDLQIVHAFDYGLFRKSKRGVVNEERYLALLASSLVNEEAEGVGDFFSYTGEFAVRASRRVNRRIHCLLGHVYPMTLEQAMRLRIHGVSYEFIRPRNESEFLSSVKPCYSDVLLLNPPVHKAGKIRSRISGFLPATKFASELEQFKDSFRIAIINIPKSDAKKNGREEGIRQSLIRSGQVLAVIDSPKSATSRIESTCWIIGGGYGNWKNAENDILFIDADALSHLLEAKDIAAGIEFIKRLILLVHDEVSVSVKRQDEEWSQMNTFLSNVFQREFSHGYHDVPGLCRLLSIDEIAGNGYKLVASEYLTPVQEDSWLTGLDWREVQVCLDKPLSQGRTIYVIGNNGEGKSLLLRDVADRSIKKDRKTIAIALGASDRFKFESDGENYAYLGVRTSKRGVDLKKMAVDAGQLMLKIHSEKRRVLAFNEVANIVGFSPEYFLIPTQRNRSVRAQNGPIGGVIRLDSQSDYDVELLEQVRANRTSNQFMLGLRKAGNRDDSIIPFDELSSGEQQIIVLAAKIVAHADEGALFLIDEPEISLHVSWQRAIPRVLSTIAKIFHVDICVATHSPVLVASATDDFDFCFATKNRVITPLSREDCQSVDTVLFEGFRTHTSNNRNTHERCASLVAACIDLVNQDQFAEKDVEEILAKLSDMQNIVEAGESVLGKNSGGTQVHLELIEKSKSAIREMIQFRTSIQGEVI